MGGYDGMFKFWSGGVCGRGRGVEKVEGWGYRIAQSLIGQ